MAVDLVQNETDLFRIILITEKNHVIHCLYDRSDKALRYNFTNIVQVLREGKGLNN